MTLLLRVRREAARDLDDAATWYEEQRSGLGLDFLEEVRLALRNVDALVMYKWLAT